MPNKYSQLKSSMPQQQQHIRVSTNLTEQISRFPGDSRRDFKKNPGHVCIASACYVPNLLHLMDAVYPVLSLLTPEITVILFTRYCLSDLVPSFMTGNQCGRASYTKISRRTIKFEEISRRVFFKFQ